MSLNRLGAGALRLRRLRIATSLGGPISIELGSNSYQCQCLAPTFRRFSSSERPPTELAADDGHERIDWPTIEGPPEPEDGFTVTGPPVAEMKTVEEFNKAAVIASLDNDWESVAAMMTYLREHPEMPFKPDAISYQLVIAAYCHLGLGNKALRRLTEMWMLELTPAANTFDPIFDVLQVNGNWKMIIALADGMRAKGIELNTANYTVMAISLAKAQQWPGVLKALENMMDEGHELDVDVVNVGMVASLRQRNLIAGRRFSKAIVGRGNEATQALRVQLTQMADTLLKEANQMRDPVRKPYSNNPFS